MTGAVDVVTGEVHAGVEVYQRADLITAAPVADVVAAQDQYRTLCRALLDASDYQTIGGRSFPKKSAWRKLAVAFNVSTTVIAERIDRDEVLDIRRASVTCRAVAPNGRSEEALGVCDVREKCCPRARGEKCNNRDNRHDHCESGCSGWRHFSHPEHDVVATAHTRAKNRACSDLFGMGEVSAEEVGTADQDTDAPETLITADHRSVLSRAVTALGPNAQAWLLPVKNADDIPSIGNKQRFNEHHRDRMAWHILCAQTITEPEPDADEPIPADAHDHDTTPEAYERNPKYDPDDARPGRPMP
jgi:hypothetical protein